MDDMNRRRFIQSLAAVFSLPAGANLSLGSASAALPAAAAVPAKARFWAIYMSALHGECTPQTLQNLLHIPEVDAKRYMGQLIADGVIKPNPLLRRGVSNMLNSNEDRLKGNIQKRLEMKEQAKASPELKTPRRVQEDQEEENQGEAEHTRADKGLEKQAGELAATTERDHENGLPDEPSIEKVETANAKDPQGVKATSA